MTIAQKYALYQKATDFLLQSLEQFRPHQDSAMAGPDDTI